MAKAAKSTDTKVFPVEFGGVGIGDATARLGLKFDIKVMSVKVANELLCGTRLTIKAVLGRPGDEAGQAMIPWTEDAAHEIEASVDVKRFSVSPKNITAGLTFQVKGLDVESLSHFAKRSGKLHILDVQEIPEDEAGDEDEE